MGCSNRLCIFLGGVDIVLVFRVFSVEAGGWPGCISVARSADIWCEIFVCVGAAPGTAARDTPEIIINGGASSPTATSFFS